MSSPTVESFARVLYSNASSDQMVKHSVFIDVKHIFGASDELFQFVDFILFDKMVANVVHFELSNAKAGFQEALEKVMVNRTVQDVSSHNYLLSSVLVIAHRLSTIQNADTIVVISKGRIAEMGTHSQLIKDKRLYWNLIRQQFDTNDG
ncbi:unnamed protein product [Medioppia subpectinata]|uniref:Uncharacterized protein n=1 Tax=Medioppia subpectinata TaxID=1979941 RepID=A0A7R9PUQ3_9ACAR|nr:unnamed protein product [Medioppia subpectinata]CAG2102013.1 unnamed protein product [Medioppia subpectinata]